MDREFARQKLLENFDPNGPGMPGALFGLPFTPETAEVIIIPLPWEATVSYRGGTAQGPTAIVDASVQVDLADPEIRDAWSLGIHMLPIDEKIRQESIKYRELAESYIHWLQDGELITENMKVIPHAVDEMMEKLYIFTRSQAQPYIDEGRIVAVLGGDHSTPLGLIRALASKYTNFGILQIDAHADLRERYEDFKYSHASIMYNALKIPSVKKLVQVGIRDICDEELKRIQSSDGRIATFFNESLCTAMFQGETWDALTDKIVSGLPRHVYISFDIDGLDPSLCPNTGTPVPGGLSLPQVRHLMRKLAASGRKIIGFDLNEVAPGKDEWDANVGARVLYMLSIFAGVSHGKLAYNSSTI